MLLKTYIFSNGVSFTLDLSALFFKKVFLLFYHFPDFANTYQFYQHITYCWWRRIWQLTSVFFPGASHGQRSLAGYSPWAHKELDMTEVT